MRQTMLRVIQFQMPLFALLWCVGHVEAAQVEWPKEVSGAAWLNGKLAFVANTPQPHTLHQLWVIDSRGMMAAFKLPRAPGVEKRPDAEGVDLLPDGSVIVAHERRGCELVHYDLTGAVAVVKHRWEHSFCKGNNGVEGVAIISDWSDADGVRVAIAMQKKGRLAILQLKPDESHKVLSKTKPPAALTKKKPESAGLHFLRDGRLVSWHNGFENEINDFVVWTVSGNKLVDPTIVRTDEQGNLEGLAIGPCQAGRRDVWFTNDDAQGRGAVRKLKSDCDLKI